MNLLAAGLDIWIRTEGNRGGSFDSNPQEHPRLSFRQSFGKGMNALGFRCVIEATPQTGLLQKR